MGFSLIYLFSYFFKFIKFHHLAFAHLILHYTYCLHFVIIASILSFNPTSTSLLYSFILILTESNLKRSILSYPLYFFTTSSCITYCEKKQGQTFINDVWIKNAWSGYQDQEGRPASKELPYLQNKKYIPFLRTSAFGQNKWPEVNS